MKIEDIYEAESGGHIIRPDGSSIISSLASVGDVIYHNQTKQRLENIKFPEPPSIKTLTTGKEWGLKKNIALIYYQGFCDAISKFKEINLWINNKKNIIKKVRLVIL